MDTTVETSTPTPTPTTPPPGPTPDSTEQAALPTESASISEHAASFDPAIPDEERKEHHSQQQRRNDEGKWRPGKHRARSQQASAEDVPRIKELTKNWRQEEAARKALEEKYAALEREITTLKAPNPTPPPDPPAAFADTEPTLDQFAQDADPYLAYSRALAAYDRKKEAAEAARTQHQHAATAYAQAQTARAQAQIEQIQRDYDTRLQTFMAATPDFQEVIAKAPTGMTPVLYAALLTDERGPEFVYTLAQRPDLLAELLLLSDGRAVAESTVATMRRVLASRMPVAVTGSTRPASPTYQPPKPPNPVRTGPVKTAENPLESAPTSIADHAKHFGPKRPY